MPRVALRTYSRFPDKFLGAVSSAANLRLATIPGVVSQDCTRETTLNRSGSELTSAPVGGPFLFVKAREDFRLRYLIASQLDGDSNRAVPSRSKLSLRRPTNTASPSLLTLSSPNRAC